MLEGPDRSPDTVGERLKWVAVNTTKHFGTCVHEFSCY